MAAWSTAHFADACAGCEREDRIGHFLPVAELHGLAGAVDGCRAGVQYELAFGFGVELVGFDEQALGGKFAGEESLGKRRALIGNVRFFADQRDRPGIAFAAQAGRQLRGGARCRQRG